MTTVADILAVIDRLAPFRSAALVWLCLAGTGLTLAADKSPEPAAAPKPDATPVIAALEAMSSSVNPAVKFYTKRLAEALAKNDVAVSKSLLELKPSPKAQVAVLGLQDRQRIAAAHGAFGDYLADTIRIRGEAAAYQLSADLLVIQAEACPDIEEQMDGTYRLIMECRAPERSYVLDYAVVARAMDAAVARAIKVAGDTPSEDVVNRLIPLTMGPLVDYIVLKALVMSQPTKEVLDKILDDLAAKVTAARKMAKNEGAIKFLDRMSSQANDLRVMTGKMAGIATSYQELARLAAALIDAVNKNDQQTVLKYCMPKVAARVRDGVQAPEMLVKPTYAREIRFVALRLMKIEEGQVRGIMHLMTVDKDGRAKAVAHETGFVNTDAGWRVADP